MSFITKKLWDKNQGRGRRQVKSPNKRRVDDMQRRKQQQKTTTKTKTKTKHKKTFVVICEWYKHQLKVESASGLCKKVQMIRNAAAMKKKKKKSSVDLFPLQTNDNLTNIHPKNV